MPLSFFIAIKASLNCCCIFSFSAASIAKIYAAKIRFLEQLSGGWEMENGTTMVEVLNICVELTYTIDFKINLQAHN